MVPVTIWLIVSDAYLLAFIAFVAAGISDAVDGFIAKRFDLETKLGAYLDPIADKLLLVGIYVVLGMFQHLPVWLVILVASRDILIIGGMLLAWLIDRPIEIHPLMVSKINTTLQIALAGLALGLLAFEIDLQWSIVWGSAIVGLSTIASGGAYIRQWLRHMSSQIANGNGNGNSNGNSNGNGNGNERTNKVAPNSKSD